MRYFVRSLSALALVLMSCTSSPAPVALDAGIPIIGKPVFGSFGNFPPTPNPSRVTYPLLATDGTLGAPSYSFASEATLGFYRISAGKIAMVGDNGVTIIDTGAGGAALTAGVIRSERGGSTGVVVVDDSAGSLDGIALVGGSGGNGYARWHNGAGADDVSLWRSGTNELSVGVGSNTGSAGNLKANQITATTYVGLPAREFHVDAYDAADNSTSNKLQAWPITNASTLVSGSFTGSVVGVGAGNYVVKLCSDGSTCSGANLKATCTISCTATVGTNTACTINNATIAASATLTLEPSTACGTTAESGNFTFNFSQP